MGDIEIFRFLNGLAGKASWFDTLIRFFINDYLIPVAAALVLGWMWFAGRDRAETERFQTAVFTALLTMAWITIMVQITNAVWPRPRPFSTLEGVNLLFYRPRDPSFPAHPVAIITGVGVTALRAHPRSGWSLVAAAVMFGVARVVAGVWYPTDVLGGIAYGLFGACLGLMTIRRMPGVVQTLRSTARRWSLG